MLSELWPGHLKMPENASLWMACISVPTRWHNRCHKRERSLRSQLLPWTELRALIPGGTVLGSPSRLFS